MPLKTMCPGCGKNLDVPDSAVGKRVKCPACSHTWQIPKPVVDAEAVPETPPKNEWFDEMMSDDYPLEAVMKGPAASAGPSQPSGEPPRRPCPQCGEMIPIGAAKCRFCDAIFDAQLLLAEKKKKRKSSSGSDDDLTAVDWVLCILCAGIGCIVGIVNAVQGKPKGFKMIGISLLAALVWNILRFLLEVAAQGPNQGFNP